LIAALAAASALPAVVAAQSVVTACASADAPGGLNLRAAVAAGGSISFDCGALTTALPVASPLNVVRPVQIDGGGRIKLVGSSAGPVFRASASMLLANMEVSNPAPSTEGIVRGQQSGSEVVLRNVRTTGSANAYQVGTLRAQDSTFVGNGGVNGVVGLIVDAEVVQLTKSTFEGNHDHPVGGGLAPGERAPLSRRIEVADSVFTQNTASLLAHDAVVTIEGSRFEGNGAASAQPDGGWSCCAGAITVVRSRLSVVDCQFTGNRTSGFGGAVLALGSDVRLRRSHFTQNQAVAGGAVFSLGHALKTNDWSTGPGGAPVPGLVLTRSQFRDNAATAAGGAIAWAGRLGGDQALFSNNRAVRGGAIAHTSAIALPPDLPALVAWAELTTPMPEGMELARGAFIGNEAGSDGAAIAGGQARVVLGNALVIRNTVVQPGQGAALVARRLDLRNATVAHNASGGLRVLTGSGSVSAISTVILDNQRYGCVAGVAQWASNASSLQYPGNDCSGVRVAAPELASNYRPTLGGASAAAGNLNTCLSDPLVAGVDLGGMARGTRGVCSVGAYEPDIRVDPVTGWNLAEHRWAKCVLFWLVLLVFLISLVWSWRKARRKRQDYARKPA